MIVLAAALDWQNRSSLFLKLSAEHMFEKIQQLSWEIIAPIYGTTDR